jgi:ArsR family transcriptional regulator
MDARIRNKFEARASIIKALAHPTRLFIVDEIAKGERCVCELTEMIGADMSTVSKHLSVLKLAGLVSDEKRGLMVYYRLTTPCLTGLFNCVEGVLRSREERRLAEAQD